MKRELRTFTLAVTLALGSAGAQADILREYWTDIPGAAVSDLTANVNYPDNPSGCDQLASFEAPANWADDYGTRLRGYLTPSVSGSYVFWIASDDAGELWLSTDDDPDNKSRIAFVDSWTGSREWNKASSQKSAAINLIAGRRYYVEALQKEGGGDDNLAIGWAKPGQSTDAPSEVIPGSVLSPWTGPDPSVNSRPIITRPNDVILNVAPATIQLTAMVTDDGQPLPANPSDPNPTDPHKLRWSWSLLSAPPASRGVAWSGNPNYGKAFTYADSPNLPGTIFCCNPTATFDVPGLYTLQFGVNDGQKASTVLVSVFVNTNSSYRDLGYLYLSPLPGAEYAPPQTRFILVRFKDISPAALTNLADFIQVIGARSGIHTGQTRIATDGRTVVFDTASKFDPNELVTVRLSPAVPPGTPGAPGAYMYQFMVSAHLPDVPPSSGGDTTDPQNGTISARGETPPNQTKAMAFDNSPSTQWSDPNVPNGSGMSSWIQYDYPGGAARVVTFYTITSAGDAPERDPRDWFFYGVDALGHRTLLDSQTNQAFYSRLQQNTYLLNNTNAYTGYRLEITSVSDPDIATSVQLAELEFSCGAILREYWTGIPGGLVSDLTGNALYPDSPSASDHLASFEAPTDWGDNYGTRVRGYLTPPLTGGYLFWIASDDTSELWLSTDDDPGKKSRIAYLDAWTGSREWNKAPTQKSAVINLTAGRRYYVEALQKEAGGGDNLAVGWARPGQPTNAPSEVIPGSVMLPCTNSTQVLALAPGASSRTPLALSPPSSDAQVAGLPAATPSKSDGSSAPKTLALTSAIKPNGVSVPGDFPQVVITVNSNPSPGYIFLENIGQSGAMYLMILDNNGSPVWYHRGGGVDFKVQNNGIITWARFSGVDQNFNYVRSYQAVNGYDTDMHELQVLADGTSFLLGLHREQVDMSRYLTAGNTSASVEENVIQQFTPDGQLIFQWRAWDHLDILGQQEFVDNRSAILDFPHMNAIDVDEDGHILLSSRSTSEVTKINRDSGEIIWRLGGTHGQFAFVNDPLNGFRNQHAIRALGGRHYTIFDNGNTHNPPMTRAVEYELDLTNQTARLVWQYPATPTTNLYVHYMGNAQRLANGNTHLDLVLTNYPKALEVDSSGAKHFELNVFPGSDLYRSFRCGWTGMVAVPYLILEPQPDKITLLFNKFGDPGVDHYRIYGGTSSQPTTLLATSTATLASLRNLENLRQYYFRVTAVGKNGVESDFSNEESVFVNIVLPGQNMVLNGDLSLGTNSWFWTNTGTATATWAIANGASFVHITSPGAQLADIQIRQAGLKLIQGSQYILEFDAWAAAPRLAEARLSQDQPPFTAYKIASPSLTPIHQHFSYLFSMTSPTDLNTRLSFNLGASTRDVYLDNVSLWMVAPGDFNRDHFVGFNDLSIFAGQWLRQGTGLSPDLNGDATVDFKDFRFLGDNWSGGMH